MNRKIFSERFNQELCGLNFPSDLTEKAKAVADVFGVKCHLAKAMIFGYSVPSQDQLVKIAEILEVCPQWLQGKSDRKKAVSQKDTQKEG